MKKEELVTERPSMLKMTWPIFIELALQIFVGYIDQFMISRFDETLVGAVTNATQILNLVILVFSVVSTATTILIVQHLGAKEYGKLSEIYTLSVAINIVFSSVISLLLFLLAPNFAVWMRIPVNMQPHFIAYMQIVGGGMFLQAIFLIFSAFYKSNGLMKHTMLFAVIMNALNLIGNFLLIYGIGPFPTLGIKGAAISTVFSKLVGAILIVAIFFKVTDVKLDIKTLKPFPADTFKKILKIGIPSAGENVSYDSSILVILIFVNMLGEVPLNTRSYGVMFSMLCCVFTMAVGNALRITVGYLIGAKRHDEVAKVITKSIIWSLIISVGTTVLILIFSDAFFGLFTDNPEILALGKKAMFVEIFLEIGRTINIIMVSSLQAAGDIKFPVTLGIISNWTVAVVLSYVFGIVLGFGLVGIWWAMAIDEILRGVIFIFRFKSGAWRKKDLLS
ncbi:MAG: MATE family efflux transporter [Oscillospiraceae bacterium]